MGNHLQFPFMVDQNVKILEKQSDFKNLKFYRFSPKSSIVVSCPDVRVIFFFNDLPLSSHVKAFNSGFQEIIILFLKFMISP